MADGFPAGWLLVDMEELLLAVAVVATLVQPISRISLNWVRTGLFQLFVCPFASKDYDDLDLVKRF